MPDKERGAQAKGIPPESFMDLAQFAPEAIPKWSGKPATWNFGDYEDYLEALDPQEKRRRIDQANTQIVKLARQAIKAFRKAS